MSGNFKSLKVPYHSKYYSFDPLRAEKNVFQYVLSLNWEYDLGKIFMINNLINKK